MIIINTMCLIKYLCEKFSCKSTCMYNLDEEVYDRHKLYNIPLEHYQLKIKDIKKIMKILNKREYITFPKRFHSTEL